MLKVHLTELQSYWNGKITSKDGIQELKGNRYHNILKKPNNRDFNGVHYRASLEI